MPSDQRFLPPDEGRLRQGEVIAGLPIFMLQAPFVDGGSAELLHRPESPWCIVLTQDCDLQQSHLAVTGEPHPETQNTVRSHNRLWSVLIAPGFDETLVTKYEHLQGEDHKDLGDMRMGTWEGRLLGQNRLDRYHRVAALPGLLETDIVFDFKLAMGVSPEYLNEALRMNLAQRVGRLGEPWVQDLAHRYIAYLGRVALPDEALD